MKLEVEINLLQHSVVATLIRPLRGCGDQTYSAAKLCIPFTFMFHFKNLLKCEHFVTF